MVKRNVIFLSVLVLTTMLVGIGVSYSLWNISTSQDTTNIAETKCFDLSISSQENSINLDNAYPISNDKGKSLTPYTFTVTNTCDITTQYNINLEVLNSSTLSSNFIDVMFEGNINLLSSYDNTDKVNTSSIESRKLTTGILKSQESKDYSLRLWIDYNTTLEDLNNEIKTFKSKIVVVGKPINYTGETVFDFDYTGGEQTFIAPVSGTYKLETWGAEGGTYKEEYHGGYGGYSEGKLNLSIREGIYISVGGVGIGGKATESKNYGDGGYNGGGSRSGYPSAGELGSSGGGGATHIATKSGLLSALENYENNILIVSGGGGGAGYVDRGWNYNPTNIPSGGGFSGNAGQSEASRGGLPGTQNSGELFGQGANCGDINVCDGGGGGYYGGKNGHSGAGGGSGYIGNYLLTNKVMYCYNCEESFEESTKTISTTCKEETPTSYCAKKGNGYARITLVSIDE